MERQKYKTVLKPISHYQQKVDSLPGPFSIKVLRVYRDKNTTITLEASYVCRTCGHKLKNAHERQYSKLRRRECPKCEKEKSLYNFKQKAAKEHDDFYDYSLTKTYPGLTGKATIKCPIHGVFKQEINAHVYQGHGCPSCRESTLERKIRHYLKDNKISFKQKLLIKDHNHPGIRHLRMDFFLPQKKLYIQTRERLSPSSYNYPICHRVVDNQRRTDAIKEEYAFSQGMTYEVITTWGEFLQSLQSPT